MLKARFSLPNPIEINLQKFAKEAKEAKEESTARPMHSRPKTPPLSQRNASDAPQLTTTVTPIEPQSLLSFKNGTRYTPALSIRAKQICDWSLDGESMSEQMYQQTQTRYLLRTTQIAN